MNWTTLPTLLAILLWAIPVAQAGLNLTQSLGLRLEAEVRHRAGLHVDAELFIEQLRVSNSALAARATSVKRVELPVGEDGLGRVAAKALLVSSDGSERWTWLEAHVDATVPTVVASRALTRGETVTRGDVELAMLPVHRQSLTEPDRSIGQVLKRAVRAGEPVRSSWLTRAYAVKRGDIVETMVRRGAIVARGSAEVSERGRVGDIIRIKVVSSRRTLRARVLDDQHVEVVR